MNSLCNDCKNTSCPMQSGIKRIECAFHIPTNKSGYVPLETVFDLTEYMCRDCHSNCKECILAEPLELLKNMEPADVRPVVRCKDCKYYKEGKLLGPTKFCYYYKIGTGLNTADDDFCSKGERREPNLDTTKGEGRDESNG